MPPVLPGRARLERTSRSAFAFQSWRHFIGHAPHVPMTTTRALSMAVCVVIGAGTMAAALQEPQPPAVAPQQGQGQGAGGRQGGGGRGPNFAQQQRPLADPAVIDRGRALYGVNCTACHGVDLRGGDQGGPNLLRSAVVLTDQKGENILAVVRSGQQGPTGTMPAFQLPDGDVVAIAEYVHSVLARAGRQGRPPEADRPFELNLLVGDPSAGAAYFDKACSRCHSTTGDLKGLAMRVPDPRALQNLWVAGRAGGRGGGDDDDNATTAAIRVTVTPRGGGAVTGRLVRIDDFTVTLVLDDGARRTFRREGGVAKVEIHDRLEPHRRLASELSDRDMHDITAYLATLK
jgi:cytochrome c oxidase cbb3-type subunit 3